MNQSELKKLIRDLRINFETNQKTSEVNLNSDYSEGIQSGIKLTNNSYLSYIEKLERLMEIEELLEV